MKHFVLKLLLLVCFSAAPAVESSFNEANPIKLVTSDGGLREFESSVLQISVNTRHALSYAYFDIRYVKKYDIVEELKLRFGIFSKNLKLIRSTCC